jgi:acetoacetyl-CoA synthetase
VLNLDYSDGTLNPSGIRFGSAEIYSIGNTPVAIPFDITNSAIVESPKFNDMIADTLCVGRKRPSDRDEDVFLFVRMRENFQLTDALRRKIEVAIRTSLSPRHVPRFILPIEAIPVTINGKKVEIAVKKLISGANVKVSSTG